MVRDARSVLARGAGCSYGDAALNAGGMVVAMLGVDCIGAVDAIAQTVSVDAGVRLGVLSDHLARQGWALPVVPGTRHVTVGGAIAADVHGKNHRSNGSLSSWVRSMDLVTPLGASTVSPVADPELFWATTGGMGLTGIVTTAVLSVAPIGSGWYRSTTRRTADLDDISGRDADLFRRRICRG